MSDGSEQAPQTRERWTIPVCRSCGCPHFPKPTSCITRVPGGEALYAGFDGVEVVPAVVTDEVMWLRAALVRIMRGGQTGRAVEARRIAREALGVADG